jgi:predicted Zn-dependent protease
MLKKIALIVLIFSVAACKSVPITGRKQLNFISFAQMAALSEEGYRQQLKDLPLSNNTNDVRRINAVSERLIAAIETYLKDNKIKSEATDFKWEVNLLENKEANAFCMEGGKIAFYTGIMPYCTNDDAIAVVMGHEIGHAIAHHGGERMSELMIAQYGNTVLDAALSKEPAKTRSLADVAYGLGSQVFGILPFSRLHESEADELGLNFMTMAGYNPNEAIKFWERMEAGNTGTRPPQIISTHPSPETRIANIKKLIPVILEKYGKN